MIIYFTRSFSTTYHMIVAIRTYFAQQNISLIIIVSHPDKTSLTLQAADISLIEPSYDAYKNDLYYQDIVKKYGVQLIIPGESSLVYFKDKESAYHKLGAQLLISGNLDLLTILRSKTSTYEFFQSNHLDVAIPVYRRVDNLTDFLTACNEINATGSLACFKPDVSQGASGFRIIDDTVLPMSLLSGFPSVRAPLDYYVDLFMRVAKFPTLIVSEYLSGEEVTLDILAHQSKCVFYFPRFKHNYDRVVKDDPSFMPLILDFIQKSGIQFLFNIQLRYHRQKPYLLEVNPRYSGGSYIAEKNGYPMLASAINLCFNIEIQTFNSLEESSFKIIADCIKCY